MQHSRLFTFLLFVLSMGLFAYAAPTETTEVVKRGGNSAQDLLTIILNVKAQIDAVVNVLVGLVPAGDPTSCINQIVVILNAAVTAIAALKIDLSTVDTVTLNAIANGCADIIVGPIVVLCKFTVIINAVVLAALDVALKAFISACGASITGLLTLIIKACLAIIVDVQCFVKLHLVLTIAILGLVV